MLYRKRHLDWLKKPSSGRRRKAMRNKLLKKLMFTITLAVIVCSFSFTLAINDGSAKMTDEGNNAMTTKTAIFAGGCFWCTESDLEKVEGVVKVFSGYTGGKKENPSYQEVSSGSTSHYEAVLVMYDPSKVTYSKILDAFWRSFDPTDDGGQFVDRGSQYRSAIFYNDDEQKRLAGKSKEKLSGSGVFKKPIVTKIIKAGKNT